MEPLKILIITGTKSQDELERIVQKANSDPKMNVKCDVTTAARSVSAFITKNDVRQICGSVELNKYNMILLPGFTPWDAGDLAKEYNIEIKKGTRFAAALIDLFPHIRDVKLSSTKPADKFLVRRSKNKIKEHVDRITGQYKKGDYGEANENFLEFEDSDQNLVYVGTDFPPLLFAEIVNAPKLDEKEILNKVNHYIKSGADVIDVGTIVGQDDAEFVSRIIPMIKQNFDVFVSIDTVEIREMEIAINSGVDFILSIDLGNLDEFLALSKRINIRRDVGLVLIPLEGEKHVAVQGADAKVDCLFQLAMTLSKHGFENLFYDPLLKTPISPGIIPSLADYILLRERVNQIPGMKYPLFMGFNNVFELVDADSPGINALLTMIALELGVCGILTTEYSAKSLGAVLETTKSIKLAYWAKVNNSPPINLGIDAFFCKSKLRSAERDETPSLMIDTEDIEQSTTADLPQDLIGRLANKPSFVHDAMGYFKIFANHKKKRIELIYYPSDDAADLLGIKKPVLISGRNPETVYKKLDQLGIVDEITHAFYLGKELARAEIAIETNSVYQEDVDITP